MIRIQKTPSDRPSIIFSRGPRKGLDKLEEATKALKARYLQYKTDIKLGKKKFKFDSNLYGHKAIKAALKRLQHNKCCFCEAKISHIAYGDVEHFRPKAAYKRFARDSYQYPGYYWLAYNWDNLFFSCQRCNQEYKRNLFLLADETTRVLSHEGDISTEEYIFLHPSHDNPEEHITFEYEVPKAKNNSLRAKETIERLGIDRFDLNEHRYQQLKKYLDMLHIIEQYPDIPAMKPHHDAAKAYLKVSIHKDMRPEAEYSAMFKTFYEKRIRAILEE